MALPICSICGHPASAKYAYFANDDMRLAVKCSNTGPMRCPASLHWLSERAWIVYMDVLETCRQHDLIRSNIMSKPHVTPLYRITLKLVPNSDVNKDADKRNRLIHVLHKGLEISHIRACGIVDQHILNNYDRFFVVVNEFQLGSLLSYRRVHASKNGYLQSALITSYSIEDVVEEHGIQERTTIELRPGFRTIP